MKEAVFIVAAALGPPLIAILLRYLPMGHRLGLAALVASVTVVFDVNFFPEMAYRGMSRALNLSSVDILCWGLLLFLFWQRRVRGVRLLAPQNPGPVSPIVLSPALSAAFAAFVSLNIISLLGADVLHYGLFDLFKLVSGYLLFWLTVNLIVDDPVAEAVPRFLAIFVGIEVLYAMRDFATGVYWVAGTFPHKNSFAFAMNVVLPFLLARGLLRPKDRLFYLGLYALGTMAVVVSRSRTAWMTMLLSAAIVIALSFLAAARHGSRRDVRRIFVVIAGLALMAMAFGAKMADGIIARWGESAEASSHFRDVQEEVAIEMITTNPLGVGANQYVKELQKPVGDPLDEIDKIVVHNTYLLIAAEVGWLGLAAFVTLLLSFGVVALRMYRQARSLRGVYVATGALAALITSMIHGTMESHVFLERQNFSVWCLMMGVVVGVGQREGIDRVSLIRWLVRRRILRGGAPLGGRRRA